jgi:hypothetical protein
VLIFDPSPWQARLRRTSLERGKVMTRQRTIGTWAIIAGVILDNISYLADLIKDRTGVIILGNLSVAGILFGIALIAGGTILLRTSGSPVLPVGIQERVAND